MYGSPTIYERHRHRYEVNNKLLPQIEAAGLKVTGLSADKKLVEIIEIPDHPGSWPRSSTRSSPRLPVMATPCSPVL